jgi:cholesterol transport system auxiliary component
MPILPNATPNRSAAMRLAACALLVLLSGCSLLGGKPKEAITVFSLDPRVAAEASWPTVPWQLALNTPTASRMDDSVRITVRPSPHEVQVYKGASWSKRPSEMLGDAVLRALEDSGKIAAVARQGSGIGSDYKLLLDIRRFESDYAGQAVPAATIEVNAKLLHGQDPQVVLSRTFLQAQPAAGVAVADVVAAFEHALTEVSRDIGGWALIEGDRHERGAHR